MPIAAVTLKPSTTPRPLPGAMKTAITAPGPVSIASTGSVDGGSVALEATVVGNRAAYWGYAWKAANAHEQPSLANGAIVEGFTGCTQGGLVYVGDDGTLTHTPPLSSAPIGIAVRTTAIYFYLDPAPTSAEA